MSQFRAYWSSGKFNMNTHKITKNEKKKKPTYFSVPCGHMNMHNLKIVVISE